MHVGGKIEVRSKVPLHDRDDLSMAYTPGVARVCTAIEENPSEVHKFTIKRNTVAIVTDGTAVLGLGDIGPHAALPVMEGKAMLFKEFAGIDAFPICLNVDSADQLIETVERLEPVFGGINLEDIAAPRCFEVEERLKASLDIPVFHDDQHGTAVVVLAALRNALKVVDKKMEDLKVVIAGVGAAGVAITKILQAAGVPNVIGIDRKGAIYSGRGELDASQAVVRREHEPRDAPGRAARSDARCRRVHRRVRAGPRHPRRPAGHGTTTRSCSRSPTRRPRSCPRKPRGSRRSSPPVAPTTRTRSTTCCASPASSAARSTPARPRSPRT